MTATMNKPTASNLSFQADIKRGDNSPRVTFVQEWLSLHGLGLSLDGDFGPATEAAVKQFQHDHDIASTGIVNQATFDLLIAPMTAALKAISPAGHTVASLTLAYAQQHLAQHPREIGGQNMGPWVRLYMDGNQGTAWPWCAGFVSFCLKAACHALGLPTPFTPSYSCTFMAGAAQNKGIFLHAPDQQQKTSIVPGSIFLLEKTDTVWQHTGIVTSVDKDYFHTIEGNTNDDGSPEGYEVCKRIRGYNRMDFITLS